MASRKPKGWYDKRALPHEDDSDLPATMDEILAQERERRTGRAPDDFDFVPVDGQGVTR